MPVAPTWLGHRPEPFIHERVWACPLRLDAGARSSRWAAFDEAGRCLAMRDHEDYVEHVTYEPRVVVVRHEDAVIVRTELDTLALSAGGHRLVTGGRLVVEHDAAGPRAIRGEDETVWERVDEPWPELLARGAREIADGLIEAIETCGAAPGTDVFALSLTYVDDGGLHTILSFGLEEDRRAWLAEGRDEDELAANLWYLIGDGAGLNEIERYDIPAELDDLLLREACLKQAGDPQRVVLQEVARRLARHDWSGVVVPTDDFVVFVCEHDEGIAPKHTSVREVNPAERVAAWDARWPAGVSRGEDEV